MAVWSAARRDRRHGGTLPAAGSGRFISGAEDGVFHTFHQAATGRTPGSVAAQETLEEGHPRTEIHENGSAIR